MVLETSMMPIFLKAGANRNVAAIAITHPLGNPALPADEERKLHLNLVKKVLLALQTAVKEQTMFEE
jgi:glycine reductase